LTWQAIYARPKRKEDSDYRFPGGTETQDDDDGAGDADGMDFYDGRDENKMLASSAVFIQTTEKERESNIFACIE
jgi:hypothetical protein